MKLVLENKTIKKGFTTSPLSNAYVKKVIFQKKNRAELLIKHGIWIYFTLLIFEGALRKWFIPSLAAPLIIVRDPIALVIILIALQQRRFSLNIYSISFIIIGILALFTAVFFGHGNLFVALFGARILLIHIPLMFIIGHFFNRADIIAIAKIIIWITIPMTILIALQFYSPQSAWVNMGIAGDTKGSGFSGALGYFRPSATFSFTNGTTLFFSFTYCFVLYFWTSAKYINKLLLICATFCVIAAIPLSISRALFFQIVISTAFAIAATSLNIKLIGRLILIGLSLCVIYLIISELSFFQKSIEAFMYRFNSANETEGGLEGVFLDRYLGGLISAIFDSTELPFFGYGIGMGTNVGAQLLVGKRTFLVSEGEWGRVIGELGLFLGLVVVFIRIKITTEIVISCLNKLRQGDLLPWVLLSMGGLQLAVGNWSQPTALGFFTIIGGLLYASIKKTLNK